MTRPLDQITAHLHTVRDALRNARTPEDRDRALKRIDTPTPLVRTVLMVQLSQQIKTAPAGNRGLTTDRRRING